MKIFKLNPDMSTTDITVKTRLKNTLIVLLSLSTIFAFTYKSEQPQVKPVYLTVKDTVFLEERDIPLTDSAITKELVKLGCILPNVALAQIKLETSNYKSSICLENKNLAGVRTSNSEHVVKDSKGIPVKNRGHNVFKTYKKCLEEYVRIQNYYLKSINHKYAESKNYVTYLKNLK